MQKIKKILKGLLSYNDNLAPVMNRSRVFNAYMTVFELACITFYIMVAGRTNQSGLVFRFIMQSLICSASGLYIHVNLKINFVVNSMKGMVAG